MSNALWCEKVLEWRVPVIKHLQAVFIGAGKGVEDGYLYEYRNADTSEDSLLNGEGVRLMSLRARCLVSLVLISWCSLALADLSERDGAVVEREISDNPETLSLNGADWAIRADEEGVGTRQRWFEADLSTPGWVPAEVPGNIQADLESAHLLEPLWYGMGDPRLVDVACKDWWYRKDFLVPDRLVGKRFRIVFDGVDFSCDVWLNGTLLGHHAGMFRRFDFDVTDVVKPGGVNLLAVRIERMPEELRGILLATDGKMGRGLVPTSGGGITSVTFLDGNNRTRQILKGLKSPTNWGWDWGVNIYTLGIWKGVRLEASGPAHIEWLQVQTSLADEYRQAMVRVHAEVHSVEALDVAATFRIVGRDINLTHSADAALQPGMNSIEAEFVLDRPRLWWANGHGDQPLYTAELRLTRGGVLSDTRAARFGIREVRWEQVEGAPPDFINPYRLVLNGRPIRTMGSNIIPPDLLFGRINRRGPRLLRLAQKAGMNTIRVWGGGVMFTEEMLNLADELGIMLSMEFPMTGSTMEEDEIFLANLGETVRNIVKQMRNHPSIMEWSGGNEIPWKQGDDYPALHVLERITSEEDDRIFRATCAIQGGRHSPWDYLPRRHYAHYDNEALKDNYRQDPMMRYGEFGCQSPANLEVWHREIPPASQWPIDAVEDPVLIRKNVLQALISKHHWLLKFQIDGLFGQLPNLEALVEAGQFMGAEGLRYAIDALRRRGQRLGGLTTWDFNEPWPNGAGSYLVDYDGRPLMNYDFVKQALASVSLTLKYSSLQYDPSEGVLAELWLVSDAPEPMADLQWRWIARSRNGAVLGDDSGTASISPLEAKSLGPIRVRDTSSDGPGLILIELSLNDPQGARLTERVHLFAPDNVDGAFGGMVQRWAFGPQNQTLTTTSLEVRSARVWREGDIELLELELANTGGMTALFCEVHPVLAYRTDTFIENNHCSIPPGEVRSVRIAAPAVSENDLSLAQTGWRVACWNGVSDLLLPPADEVLLSIGRRDTMCREFLGYDDLSVLEGHREIELKGTRPDSAALPLLLVHRASTLPGPNHVRFVFKASGPEIRGKTRLRIHTADQDEANSPEIEIRANGTVLRQEVARGLGVQKTDPGHLAFPVTAEFDISAGTWTPGRNILDVRLTRGAFISWDALDLVCIP